MSRGVDSTNTLALPSSIPLDVQRALRTIHATVGALSTAIQENKTALGNTVGSDKESLLRVSEFVRGQLQATGKFPLVVSNLPGSGSAESKSTTVSSGPASVVGSLRESGSDVLTVTGGLNAVLGSGITLQVIRATQLADGYLAATDFAAFSAKSQMLVGAHSARPSVGTYPAGTMYFEADRSATYVVASGAWAWSAGMQVGLDANKPTDLGTGDTGYTYFSTDTAHINVWTGAAWVAAV